MLSMHNITPVKKHHVEVLILPGSGCVNACCRPPHRSFCFFVVVNSDGSAFFFYDLVSIEAMVSTVFYLGRKDKRKVLIKADL
jgi:hypothetical protein